MKQEEALHYLRLARAYCAEKLPWFAPALYKCRIHLTKKVAVAAIDLNYTIYFNPDAINQIKGNGRNTSALMQEMAFLWIHEISHLLRDHAERATDLNADAKWWNVATDLEINDNQWKGLKMPDLFPGLKPSRFALPMGKLAESYYQSIKKEEHLRYKIEAEIKSCSSSSSSSSSSSWDEGSGVHSKKRSWELNDKDRELHPIDRTVISRKVAVEMKKHEKRIGRLPGIWDRWVKDILESRTDWKKVLYHRMSRAIAVGQGLRVDYSFTRPSRRQSVYHPIITPSFSGGRSSRIAVVVDTSGSMRGAEIGQAVGEVCAVLKAFRLPVTVIPCDARAYDPIVLRTSADLFKIERLQGGGGTNMIAGINAARDLKPGPDVILVLTDGHTPYPEKPYKMQVIFGILKQGNRKEPPRPQSPPWKKGSAIDILIER